MKKITPLLEQIVSPVRFRLRGFWRSFVLFSATIGLIVGCGTSNTPTATTSSPSAESPAAGGSDPFTVGMVLVGPRNDSGWNQAHYDGMQEVLQRMPDLKFEYVDKVNPADRPNVTGAQVADDLISKGAKMVIFNSDDFKDDALETAKKHSDVAVIHASGDYAWKDGKNFKNQPNLGNIMGRMEYGKMMAGCAAALGSDTGKIGYVGALINDETRRYVSAAYLGAKHCWENVKNQPADNLDFKVTWIGFWFNIPGKTLDPTKVADDFYNGGYDVVMSGIDTPEVSAQAKKAADAGKAVKYVHYDFKGGCDLAPDICLGVPYYNWGIPYETAIKKTMDGQMPNEFLWLGPEWKDINAPTSMIGFLPGNALGDQKANLDKFIQGLGDGSVNPYQGPIKFQDGTTFVAEGKTATDQEIWYLPQLLEGMDGASK
ncbi:BMP family lipoprotein [Leptolyngbya ohadii]|uniref:BMP family lipoprotein n=1 Tax=Leptolyngbya ohadii TaxID=1962290 RepID=UPI0021F0B3F8|nr:BMP family ABC transporter substrate-binding protein [Leptolyngbya ohadii]